MNWKMISVVTLAGTSLAFGAIELAANAHLKRLSKKKALAARTVEETEAFSHAETQISLYEDLKKREAASARQQTESWKRSTRYEETKRDIYTGLEEELSKFKTSIGYDIKRRNIENTAENAIEAFKKSVDYDSQIRTLEEAISEARGKFDSQKTLFDAAGSDISDTATKLKLAAEEAKNKAVGEAEAKIKSLKETIDAERRRIEKVRQSELQKLEAQVLNEKSRLQSQANRELAKLERQFEDAKDDISRSIQSGRSQDELTAIHGNDANREIIREQERIDQQRAIEIYEDTPHAECVAEWLKAKECPKWCVIFVTSLPMIPLGYLTYRYIRFVCKVIKAM